MTATRHEQQMSIGGALTSAAQLLDRVSDTPSLDAQLLLAHALERPRSHLYGHPEASLPAAVRERYRQLVARRARGEPVAYLLGQQGFWSLDLSVSDAVLIPRPETELLVEAALARLAHNQCIRVADLGTGSGAIALAIATERPACRIIATDLSQAALTVARDNAQRLGLQMVEFRHGSWFQPVAGERFGLIAANPPYVAPGDPHLAALHFEPQTALVSSDQGRDCLRHLVAQAPAHLLPDGWLLLEHGKDQDGFVRDLMVAGGYGSVATEHDLAGHPRVTIGRLPGADMPTTPASPR